MGFRRTGRCTIRLLLRTAAILTIASTATATAACGATAGSTAKSKHRILLIVAGQSNALGLGSYAVDPTTGVDYLTHPYANDADKHDKIIWPAGWLDKMNTTRPSRLDRPQMCAKCGTSTPDQVFGPEIGLARQIWIDTKTAVTIVKTGWAVTTLAVDWNPSASGGIFSQMFSEVHNVIASDAAHGQIDTIGAFYWYQGENDAIDPSYYPKYRTNLANFISAVRAHLPMGNAPVAIAKESIAAAIAIEESGGTCSICAQQRAGDAAVRAADDWAAANIPNVVEVDTLGLPRTGTGLLIHLSNVGELTLGATLARVTEHSFP